MSFLPKGMQQSAAFFILLSALLLQSVAVPVGTHQIQLVLPVGLVSIFLLLITRRAHLNAAIILALFLMISSTIATTVINLDSDYISYLSLTYFFLLYLPFIIKINIYPTDMIFILKSFQRFVALISFLALAQIVIQVMFHYYFDIKSFLLSYYILGETIDPVFGKNLDEQGIECA